MEEVRRGIFHRVPVLQGAVIALLAGVAVLVFLWNRSRDRVATLEKTVALLEQAKRPRDTLDAMMEGKPPEVARPVYLAFLRRIFPEADGYERKPDPDRFEMTRSGAIVGYARLVAADIDCGACRDLEIFIGVDLEGRVCGFSRVKEFEFGPDTKTKDPDAFLRAYLGTKDPAAVPVQGATKTSEALHAAVLDTLRRLPPR